jgi:hypothetical protein
MTCFNEFHTIKITKKNKAKVKKTTKSIKAYFRRNSFGGFKVGNL